jgi:hypothetical protein
MNNNIVYQEPETRADGLYKKKNLAAALIMTGLLVCAIISSLLIHSLSTINSILIDMSIIAVYAIFLSALLEPKYITRRIIEPNEKPVYHEVYIDRPRVNEVAVEKPIIKETIRTVYVPEYKEVIKPMYIERKSKKLNIPRYKFLGSTQTKTYHLRSCRFSRLIKRKYKVSNNSKKYFVSKRFKACKYCISKSKKG